jgi:hypothetical protein
VLCECADRKCPAHPAALCLAPAKVTLRRIDLAGLPRVRFCQACAEDAMKAGIFA